MADDRIGIIPRTRLERSRCQQRVSTVKKPRIRRGCGAGINARLASRKFFFEDRSGCLSMNQRGSMMKANIGLGLSSSLSRRL